ncbi:protein ecdysoneless-like [Nilaparvata lugens]|uniref:protein ecdysoneless-like n=1 Tax=Nilaparvata lugens TaxID=108931 RepID=UPI00193D738A|nr:protein ecdysoneless-like [Nilaparvata lugens]
MASTKTPFEIVKEDDFVEYFLFPVGCDIDNDSSLEEVTKRVNTVVNKYASTYIWQKDQFNVIPRNIAGLPPLVDNEESLPPHLYGTLHYGENIEDEWFLVFLLQQLTKEISGLIVRFGFSALELVEWFAGTLK